MATQTTRTSDQQNQPANQGQLTTRESQQELARRGVYLTPFDFFQMSPFSLMRRMSEELDRAFTESTGGREQGGRTWAPAVEVMQREGNYVIRAELAGLNPGEVKVEITDDAVVIEGERKDERDKREGSVHVTERRYGRFYRAIPLPEGAKGDDARATFQNGVLEVTVPTDEQKSRRREIPVQSSDENAAEGSGTKPAGSSGSSTASERAA